MAKKPAIRRRIETSLMEQLALLGAMKEHYMDLIQDYLKLWDVKKMLFEDIAERGITFKEINASGMKVEKNNPSTKEVMAINKQMLSLLKELGLSTSNASGSEDDDL